MLFYQFNMCIKHFMKVKFIHFCAAGVVIFASCNPPKGIVSQGNRPTTAVQGRPQHHVNPYPVIPQKDFLYTWSGFENCNNNAQNSSTIILRAKDSTGVYISGLFNANDSIQGNLRGYVIVIKQQPISAMPATNTIEGSFSLSNDRQTLKAFLTTHINGQTDSCIAVYHPNIY